MKKKVSVIIPTYNRCNILLLCIDSILNQSISHDLYEIVIVDDYSTDNTEKECIQLTHKYNNISYIRNKTNQGPATTRNNGIKISIGELLIFLDNDLLVCNDFIELHINMHNFYKDEVIAVVSNITYEPNFLKETNYGKHMQSRAIGYRAGRYMKNIDFNNLPGNFFAGGGSSCKRKDVISNGLFDESLKKYGAEDELFGYNLIKNGGRIIYEQNAKIIHYDSNIGPYYFRIKYIELGRYSLKVVNKNANDYIKNSKLKYLISVDFKNDSLKTILIKTIYSSLCSSIIRLPIEYLIFKTDKISFLYFDPLYRYITAAWIKHGYSSKKKISKVIY